MTFQHLKSSYPILSLSSTLLWSLTALRMVSNTLFLVLCISRALLSDNFTSLSPTRTLQPTETPSPSLLRPYIPSNTYSREHPPSFRCSSSPRLSFPHLPRYSLPVRIARFGVGPKFPREGPGGGTKSRPDLFCGKFAYDWNRLMRTSPSALK